MANQEEIDSATEAALKWLTLVDEGKFAESYDEAASYFKANLTKEDWIKTIGGLRPAFGKVNSRNKKTATIQHELPGAPDGTYVVILFETSFEKKNQSVETITPMLDTNNQFHVAGYFIK